MPTVKEVRVICHSENYRHDGAKRNVTDPFCPRGTPLNRLIDEVATLMLAEFGAETRFQLRAKRSTGKTERGLALLKKAAG